MIEESTPPLRCAPSGASLIRRRRTAAVRRRLVPALAQALPTRAEVPVENNWALGLRRLAQASSVTAKASIIAWGSYFSDEDKRALCHPALLAAAGRDTAAWLAAYFDAAPAQTRLDRTLYADFLTYLPSDLMVKADRMTMAHSLEARSPFLDYRLVELTAAMPERLKIRGLTQKWLLRRAFGDLLPPQAARRRKRGFSLPLAGWLRSSLRPWAYDTLLDGRAANRGYFRPRAVQRLLDEHAAGRADHSGKIWALLTLELWHRIFIDASEPARP